jgi:hypothetical protein
MAQKIDQAAAELAKLQAEFPDLVVSHDRFSLVSLIDRGGFGEVFIATDRQTNRKCALKRLFSDQLEAHHMRRFLLEVKTLAMCKCQFLIPIVGFTVTPPYSIITEFMINGRLDVALPKRRVTPTERMIIAIGIARGMIEAHRHNIIHHDLKLASIFLDSDFAPRICDFGIGRFPGMCEADIMRRIGTLSFMAPEQITKRSYDLSVDVYAYALILYELAEGRRPFDDFSLKSILRDVCEKGSRPKFTTATPESMQSLITKCWSQNPEERPTFPQIYEELASGRAAFANANLGGVGQFVAAIKDGSLIESLRNNATPGWNENVSNACQSIGAKAVPRLLRTVAHLLRDPTPIPVQKVLLGGLVSLLNRGRAFCLEFVQFDSREALTSIGSTADHWLSIYECLINSCPEALRNHSRMLQELIANRTRGMLSLFSSYLDRNPVLYGSVPFPKLFLRFRKWMMNNSCGQHYLSLVNSMLTRSTPQLERLRPQHLSVFVDYLESRDVATVSKAYSGILTFQIAIPDYAVVAKHLHDETLWERALRVLESREWPVTEDLILGLLVRVRASPRPLRILHRLRNDPTAMSLLVEHRDWLLAASQWPLETLSVISVGLDHDDKRLLADRRFALALHYALKCSDIAVLGEIASILSKCRFNSQSLALLSQRGVLREYHAKAVEWKLIEGLATVATALAAVAYVDDFKGMLWTLQSELNSRAKAVVLGAILALSRHTQCAKRLRRIQFHRYCEQLSENREYADVAQRILALLTKEAEGR